MHLLVRRLFAVCMTLTRDSWSSNGPRARHTLDGSTVSLLRESHEAITLTLTLTQFPVLTLAPHPHPNPTPNPPAALLGLVFGNAGVRGGPLRLHCGARCAGYGGLRVSEQLLHSFRIACRRTSPREFSLIYV